MGFFSLVLLTYNQYMTLCKFKVHNIIFDIHIYCEMITIITLLTSITTHSYNFVNVLRTFKMYSLSNFRIYNTFLLTIVPLLYVTSPEITYLITGSLYLLINFTHLSQALPFHHLPLATTKPFSVFVSSVCTCVIQAPYVRSYSTNLSLTYLS